MSYGIYEFQREDAERFAREQGIAYKTRGDELQLRYCPYCRNNTDDKNTFAINLHTGQFKCLRSTCNAHGNMLTLAKDFNFSLGRDVDEYYRRVKRFADLRRFPVPVTKPEAVQYLEGRGISQKIAESYHIGVKKDDSKVLVFPFYDERGDLQFIKFRHTDPAEGQSKEWCQKDCKPILFGMDHCSVDRSGMLVLTEGQIDSLSVAEAFGGDINAVSVPTGALGFTWVPYCWDFLGEFNVLVVFGDHENGHITLLDEMARRFHGIVKHVRPEDYKDCKDANELLQKHGKQAVVDAVTNAVPVEDPHMKRISDIHRKQMSEVECFSTGIAQLDRIFGGFYMGNLVLLTGERGLGKSTLASQFGIYAIKQGYSVMYYSGELPDFFFRDWFDRQVAGDANINKLVSNLGYESYMVNANALPKMEAWYGDKAFLFSDDAVDDEDNEQDALIKTVETAIQQYQCRVLIIDNLMTAMMDDLRADLYRQQSAFVRKLAKMARDLHIFILLVVHPRKQNGYNFGNDDVMGSGNITNLADAVLRYTKPNEDDERAPDRILQVLKNRVNGRTDYSGIALFYQDSSKRISERGLFDWQFGWEEVQEPDWTDEDSLEIPFDV